MSWFTDPNCAAAAALEHVAIAYCVDFDFPSGHVRLGTWSGSLIVNGQVYLGVGGLGSISNVPEKVALASERWSYLLSGVDPSVVPESEIDNCYGRSVTEYEVWMNPTTYAVIGFEINREGRMGRVRRRDGGTPIIEVNCQTRLAILEQPDSWRYTTEHQAQFFAGDTGFDQAKELESVEIIWGGKRVEPGGYSPTYRGPRRH